MKPQLHTILGLNAPEEARKRLQKERLVLPSHENIALWSRGLKQDVLDCAQLQWLHYMEQLSFAILSLQVYSETAVDIETDEYTDLQKRIERTYERTVDIFEELIREQDEPCEYPELQQILIGRRVKTLIEAEAQLREFDQHSKIYLAVYSQNEDTVATRMAIVHAYARYNFIWRLSEIFVHDESAYREANLFALRTLQRSIMRGNLAAAEEALEDISGLDSYEPQSVDLFLRGFESRINQRKLAST